MRFKAAKRVTISGFLWVWVAKHGCQVRQKFMARECNGDGPEHEPIFGRERKVQEA